MLKNLLLCFLSAALLILSFPKFDFGPLAWMAFIPLLFVLDGKGKRMSAFYAYVTGVVFFFGVLSWFVHVTPVGMVIMVFVFGGYFALFGLGCSVFQKRNPVFRIFLIPSFWVGIEFLRAHLFSGFDWASLGHSQYKNLPFIQIADITGVFGVSFLVMMGNVALKDFLKERKFSRPMGITIAFLLLTFGYGLFQMQQPHTNGKKLNVAVIQANIDQELKWEADFWPMIMRQYMDLTRQAAEQNPDLIVWPETSLPMILWEDAYLLNDLTDFIKAKDIPILVGAVIQEKRDVYYNSGLLFGDAGELVGQYNKHHLVPFGEYIPFRGLFPFMEDILPIADFTSGDEFTVFDLDDKKISTLICFEDTVARLSKGFVQEGAEILINLTNNAWFGDTKAPYLHMQSALFRTIETRRPLVRAANTGLSVSIDAIGRIHSMVKNNQGKPTFVQGYVVQSMALNDQETFYTKFGNIFTYLCLACFLLGFIIKK